MPFNIAPVVEIFLILALVVSLFGLGRTFTLNKFQSLGIGLAIHTLLFGILRISGSTGFFIWFPCLFLLVIGLILGIYRFRNLTSLLGITAGLWFLGYFAPIFPSAVDGKHYAVDMALAASNPEWVSSHKFIQNLEYIYNLCLNSRTSVSQFGYLWQLSNLSVDVGTITRLGFLFLGLLVLSCMELAKPLLGKMRFLILLAFTVSIVAVIFAGQLNQGFAVFIALQILILLTKIKNVEFKSQLGVGILFSSILFLYPEFIVVFPVFVFASFRLNPFSRNYKEISKAIIYLGLPTLILLIFRANSMKSFLIGQTQAVVQWWPLKLYDDKLVSSLSMVFFGGTLKIASLLALLVLSWDWIKQTRLNRRPPSHFAVFVYLLALVIYFHYQTGNRNYLFFKVAGWVSFLGLILVLVDFHNQKLKKIFTFLVGLILFCTGLRMIPNPNSMTWNRMPKIITDSQEPLEFDMAQNILYQSEWIREQAAWMGRPVKIKDP